MGSAIFGNRLDLLRVRKRNKESVCLNLADPADIVRATTLIARSDVVVENFKPGMMASIGLDYETVSEANPGSSMRRSPVSISGFGFGFGFGFGQALLGYDFIMYALGGLMSITGPVEGYAQKVGVVLVDVLVAKDMIAGISAALSARERTGAGSLLELNLLSSLQGGLPTGGRRCSKPASFRGGSATRIPRSAPMRACTVRMRGSSSHAATTSSSPASCRSSVCLSLRAIPSSPRMHSG